MESFEMLFYFVSGFLAQLIDGAIGMGYGITCTTLLMSEGTICKQLEKEISPN